MHHSPALELSCSEIENLLHIPPEPSLVQTHYAQIERELLAVVFAFTNFHQYVYSKNVIVKSNHKPLKAILMKSLAAVLPRLQRMLLQLQKYSFTLHYKPGKEIILADQFTNKP